MPTVVGKSPGSRRDPFTDFSVSLESFVDSGNTITLEELLYAIVLEQIKVFEARQRESHFLRFLTPIDLDNAKITGKFSFGDTEKSVPSVDRDEAVENAKISFLDGLYWVVVDGVQINCLDQKINIHKESTITFIQLTLIAGG